jgi:hypothetical protein
MIPHIANGSYRLRWGFPWRLMRMEPHDVRRRRKNAPIQG